MLAMLSGSSVAHILTGSLLGRFMALLSVDKRANTLFDKLKRLKIPFCAISGPKWIKARGISAPILGTAFLLTAG
jgi:hypothetical protein